MKKDNDLLIHAGETANDHYALDITPERAGWRFSGIKIVELDAGGSQELSTGDDEALVLPLRGSCSVQAEGISYELAGRPDVFTAITDYLYLPRETTATITSARGGRFAIPTARATHRLEISYRPASDVHVDLRGAGSCSRQVNNYALGNDLDTDHLLVCEVLTPGGNWSSYPPHKHDTENPPVEARLEELYFYRFAKPQGFAFARVYTPDRSLDEAMTPGDCDLIVVPEGYHPVGAPHGYDCYYLNVMAGPNRAWYFTIDPDHAWLMNWDPAAPVAAMEDATR